MIRGQSSNQISRENFKHLNQNMAVQILHWCKWVYNDYNGAVSIYIT